MYKNIIAIVFFLLIVMSSIVAQTKTDGTPDMRYKENKTAASKKEQPKLKADGTPDMRFKENKKKNQPVPPKLKADGTPDKRYKAAKK